MRRTLLRNSRLVLTVLSFVFALALLGPGSAAIAAEAAIDAGTPVQVGSKRFTESYVLGEIVRQTLQRAGVNATHRQGLGNTAILAQALASGQVDVYPEYTGTIVREMLKREPQLGAPPPKLAQINEWLAPQGLQVAVPLGFNNTYALAWPSALPCGRSGSVAPAPANTASACIASTSCWPSTRRAWT